MPKQKTVSGAKKRFKVSGTGKLLRKFGMNSHNFEHKSQKRKRRLRRDGQVHEADAKKLKRQLGLR